METNCRIFKELMDDEDVEVEEVDECNYGECSNCDTKLCHHEAISCCICLQLYCHNCTTCDHINICNVCIASNNKDIVPGSLADILLRV